MTQQTAAASFTACVLRPKGEDSWAFIVLPFEASAVLPRRGRVSVAGSINGQPFQALLEPDGNKSHWLRIDKALLQKAGAAVGSLAQFQLAALDSEPEPEVPDDLAQALAAAPAALGTWQATTPLARLDWIHWITSAKQARTRSKRINDACSMLAQGERRVCCFDTSGFYSKAFSAPQVDERS